MERKEKLLKKLGERVREIRLKKNLTQVDLAAKVGKDQPSINRLETGNINPSFFYLCEIADGLEVDVVELLKKL